MKTLANLLFAVSLIILLPIPGNSCTTFVLKDSKGHVVFGRNFDFPAGYGHMHVNKRGQLKSSLPVPGEEVVEWVSRYGSVTFNQGGREFPYGGMNEAGLVIELMWLQEAQYPPHDDRHGLMELQWVQYNLDNAASVREVIANNKLIRITDKATAPLHFLVADRSGDVATIEFLDGKMVVHRGENLPYTVLANCTYETSVDFKSNKDMGTDREFTGWTNNSSGRFAEAASMVQDYDESEYDMVDYAFVVLDSVAQHPGTVWSIVYDISNAAISFKTVVNKEIRDISFADLDISCEAANLYADLDLFDGKAESLKEITVEANLDCINKVFDNVDFLRDNVTPELRQGTAVYFQSVKCQAMINEQ